VPLAEDFTRNPPWCRPGSVARTAWRKNPGAWLMGAAKQPGLWIIWWVAGRMPSSAHDCSRIGKKPPNWTGAAGHARSGSALDDDIGESLSALFTACHPRLSA